MTLAVLKANTASSNLIKVEKIKLVLVTEIPRGERQEEPTWHDDSNGLAQHNDLAGWTRYADSDMAT